MSEVHSNEISNLIEGFFNSKLGSLHSKFIADIDLLEVMKLDFCSIYKSTLELNEIELKENILEEKETSQSFDLTQYPKKRESKFMEYKTNQDKPIFEQSANKNDRSRTPILSKTNLPATQKNDDRSKTPSKVEIKTQKPQDRSRTPVKTELKQEKSQNHDRSRTPIIINKKAVEKKEELKNDKEKDIKKFKKEDSTLNKKKDLNRSKIEETRKDLGNDSKNLDYDTQDSKREKKNDLKTGSIKKDEGEKRKESKIIGNLKFATKEKEYKKQTTHKSSLVKEKDLSFIHGEDYSKDNHKKHDEKHLSKDEGENLHKNYEMKIHAQISKTPIKSPNKSPKKVMQKTQSKAESPKKLIKIDSMVKTDETKEKEGEIKMCDEDEKESNKEILEEEKKIKFNSKYSEALYLMMMKNYLNQKQRTSLLAHHPDFFVISKNVKEQLILESEEELRILHEKLSHYKDDNLTESLMNKIFTPSKTAQNGLNFVTREEEHNLCKPGQPEEIVNIFRFIYLLLNLDYEDYDQTTLIENLIMKIFPSYKIDSLKNFLLSYILKNLNYTEFHYTKFQKLLATYPKMLNSSDLLKINRSVSYMTFILKEIYDYISLKTPDGVLILILREIRHKSSLLEEKLKQLKE